MTNPRFLGGGFRTGALALALLVFSAGLSAMTVIPIRDGELYRRADVVVHGIVVSSDTVATEDGRPETVTVIRPLRVLKGQLAGYLVLHQLGGILRGGTGLRLYGRPEYTVGEEVVVFAIEREEGDFQTAEMLLGKFPIERDDAGRLFAVPALAAAREGVQVLRRPDLGREAAAIERADETSSSPLVARSAGGSDEPDSLGPPRELSRFLDFLGNGGVRAPESSQLPEGKLQPVIHQEPRMGLVPEWANFGDDTPPLVRWFNGATAAFYLDPSTGSPNITPGGGVAEATTALGWWTNDPNSTINYTKTSDTTKEPIHMSAASSSCGWNTCIGPMQSGVVGCGGPAFTVPGSPCPAGNMFRGDCYGQIMDFPSAQPPLKAAEVWLRCWTQANILSSAEVQAILAHELGHTLGLDHSDQFASPHDVCRGDEASAVMNSTTDAGSPVTGLGTDDQDAIRWLYGDGGNHCSAAPTVTSINPKSGPASGGTSITITGTGFVAGSTVKVGGVAATNVVFVGATTITCKTPALPAGTLNDVTVTNPGPLSGTLTKGWFADFSDVSQAFLYHAAIEAIVRAGITTGCGGGKFCPNDPVTRDAMAKFLLVAKHGAAFNPPAATGNVFCDVSTGTLLAKWIEELKTEGIASGAETGACGKPNYHPTDPVTRDAMAKFLELAKHGSSFSPPAATGNVFCDVTVATFLAKWMEQMKTDGITSGCGAGGCGKPDYCPTETVSRGEMAKFLKVGFGL